ncbi:MAG TPA: FG-GAP-like repeat-containing protein [Candidatus Sulfotelmatobacter sp.]|nr:FG-GAP-like repeat-containing protein [Candidatus Sulfotelmatobacter sp.]
MSRVRHYSALFLLLVLIGMTGCSGSSKPPISVSLSPAAAQGIDQGQMLSVSATVSNDTSGKGVSWVLTGPGSLSTSTTSSVTYNAPTTNVTSAEQATVTATSLADGAKSASLQITVNPLPQIPFQTLANGSVGVSYSQMITLTGGTPPFQWSVYNGPIDTGYEVGGSVPDGLTLNASTGAISGVPTGGGTWYFEVTAVDAANGVAINGFMSIEISANATAANAVPFLNQTLVPTSVAPGSASFALSVSGTGFVSGATIDFNGSPLSTTFVDSEHLAATVPATNVANASTAAVTVVNPSPGGGASNVVYLPIAAPTTTVSFASAANSPIAALEALGVTVADFNADGKADLAVAENARVAVLLGNGDGTFTPASGSPLRVLSPPYDDAATPYTGPIVAADFNHSGHQGLAVALPQNSAAAILLGKGDGTFAASSAAFVNTARMTTSALVVADFNADGNLDLAIANQIYADGLVTLGYGEGAFNQAGNLSTTGFTNGIAAGDFNGDGKLDAIVAGGSGVSSGLGSSGLGVSLGNGDGTFTPANGSPISLGQSLDAIVLADFNGDGKLDVAVTDSGANVVYILLGNGDGTFQPANAFTVGNAPESMVVGDFNSDGKLDLAVANFSDNTVTLLLGNGDGTFTQAAGSPYAVGKGPFGIATADFNADGKLDLAVINLTDGTVSVLLQQ